MQRQLKSELYAQFARIGRAIASPVRLEMLDLLAQAEKTVEEIARAGSLGVKNASAHLKILRQARLVEARKESPYVYYRLADEGVFRMLREVQALARSRLAEVEGVARVYLEGRDELEPVSAAELIKRLAAEDVTVLDVRPADEYMAGHIPGAICVPLPELESRLSELPTERQIVAYCRGPYCVYAVEAVEKLRARGFDARRLETGLPDWRMAGFPVHRVAFA